MTLQFESLSEHLTPVALAVRKYFMEREGVKAFRAEAEISAELLYRPTLLANCRDGSLLAVEVTDGTYTDALDRFVLECTNTGLPIRLFLATAVGAPARQLLELHRRAKSRGIGLVEVNGSSIQQQFPAISLSLASLRRVDIKQFPKAYRASLSQAEDTFRNGDPAKGCGRVYDVIEQCSRRVASEINRLGLWRPGVPRKNRPPAWFQTGAWAMVLSDVDEHVDFKTLRPTAVPVSKALWGRIIGLTPHRNDSGHQPANIVALRKRDNELRTRFEHAVDTFGELVQACPRVLK